MKMSSRMGKFEAGSKGSFTMRATLIFCFFLICRFAQANSILIPMDENQTNHLKAYGIAYWILRNEIEVDWLLNYRGGSFMVRQHPAIQNELVVGHGFSKT